MTYDRDSYLQGKEAQNFQGAPGRGFRFSPTLPVIDIPRTETIDAYPVKFENHTFAAFTIHGDDIWFVGTNNLGANDPEEGFISLYKANLRERFDVEEVVRLKRIPAVQVERELAGGIVFLGDWIYFLLPRNSAHIGHDPLISDSSHERFGELYRYNLRTGLVQSHIYGGNHLIADYDIGRLYVLGRRRLGDEIRIQEIINAGSHLYIVADLTNTQYAIPDQSVPDEGFWFETPTGDISDSRLGVQKGSASSVSYVRNRTRMLVSGGRTDNGRVSVQLHWTDWEPYSEEGRMRWLRVGNSWIYGPEEVSLDIPPPNPLGVMTGSETDLVSFPVQSRVNANINATDPGFMNIMVRKTNSSNQVLYYGGFPHIYRYEVPERPSVGQGDRSLGEVGFGEEEPAPPSKVTWHIPDRLFLNIPSVLPRNNLVIGNIRAESADGQEGTYNIQTQAERYRTRGPYQIHPTTGTLSVPPQSASWMRTGIDPLLLSYTLPSGESSAVIVFVSVFERESAENAIQALRQQVGAQALATLGVAASALTIFATLAASAAASPVVVTTLTQSATTSLAATAGQIGALSPLMGAQFSQAAASALATLPSAVATTSIVSVSGSIAAGAGAGLAGGVVSSAVSVEGDDSDEVEDGAGTTGASFEGIRDIPVDLTSADPLEERHMFFTQSLTWDFNGVRLHPTANPADIYSSFEWQRQEGGLGRSLVFIGESVTRSVGERYFILSQTLINDPDSNDLIVGQSFYVVVEVGAAHGGA